MRHRIKRILGHGAGRLKPPNAEPDPPETGEVVGLATTEGAFTIEYETVVLDGSYYFVPRYARERPAAKRIREGTLYEPHTHETVRSICAANEGAVITAGTFFGDMLPSFSRAARGPVYAFEPVLENYILAKLGVDRNDLENVRLFHAALSETQTNLRISTGMEDGKHLGGASHIAASGALCTTLRIDDLDIEQLALIHLDLEDHELPALKGAEATLARFRPPLLIEDRPKACATFLEALDYQRLRKIPGITIWVPKEKKGAYKKIV